MTPAFEQLQKHLKQLPGLGYRSAERIALNLLVERPERLPALVAALQTAAASVRRCARCGNLAEDELCAICADERRPTGVVCVVEQVPDLVAIERFGAFRGTYHVLHGKLSPIQGRMSAVGCFLSVSRMIRASWFISTRMATASLDCTIW